MKGSTLALVLVLYATPVIVLLATEKTRGKTRNEQAARGEYLVRYGGCSECHTPMKFTEKGPVPDMSRMLSGHPEGTKLPPPELKPGPWFAATAGMTAWAGPWGISYAANITPDRNTGIGIWTEDTFIKAMRKGRHMGDGREILPPMPWQALNALNDKDLRAIFAYLRSIPAITNRVPEPAAPKGNAPSFE